MSDTVIAVIYAAGVWLGLFYAGVRRLPFLGDSAPFGPGMLAFFWPLALPVVAGAEARKLVRFLSERRRLKAAERAKWLEAPLP